jgi:hypothetical protein
MAACFARGVTFMKTKPKSFLTRPGLRTKGPQSLGRGGVRNDRIRLGAGGDTFVSEEIRETEETTVEVNRPKGRNYHQRGHYFIFYEDGSTEH